ncbi:MAG: response regulator [Planctomycetota bacterium]|nr:MAG: response regulator [Planctomycetota bacterium]REK28469.1 MAG: response regulator [Planctomycetota bacterium]REK29112.1 MAG: response regulator [Planctomycetota bacterium]
MDTPQRMDSETCLETSANSAPADSDSCEFLLAGVGASAGGLEALQALFRAMPVDIGIAFVVVQHLSPDFKSHMQELLARETELPVHLVENGMEVEPNNVYLIPARKEMIISEGRLLLTDQSRERTLTHPIDQFFRSLASDAGRNAIGIILSGTGSDGSRGVRDIHEAGGLVLCQSEETAKFDGMPLNAQQTGVVDLVLPPQAMHEALRKYAVESLSPERLAEQQIPSSPTEGIDRVFELLQSEYGIDFNYYKAATIGRRVERRLTLSSHQNLDDYIEHLQQNREELHSLYKDLLIGVTRFFRDEEAFEALKSSVIPDILERVPPEDEVRVWCAGCGTGEEAYSLAMLLHAEFGRAQRPVRCKVFATDVHRAVLEIAAAGLYSEDAVDDLPDEYRDRYFERVENGYQVRSEIRKMNVFAPHNVISDAPFTQMDLVTCRNLLIYLQPVAQKKALSLFHFSLKQGGTLFLGPSETPGEIADEFQEINKRWKLYRKRRDVRLPAELRMPLLPRTRSSLSTEVRPPPTVERNQSQHLLWMYDQLLDAHMPPGFLIDEQFQLLHTFSGAERYLKVRSGRTSTNLLDLVAEDLKTPIAGAVRHALKDNRLVSYSGVRTVLADNQTEHLRLVARPLTHPRGHESRVLVKLEKVEAPESRDEAAVEVDVDELTRDRLESLESELDYTRQNLQTTIEELETTNEELQASNEELVASNEELQSTNEELHSVNEELYTVNSEHQKKIDELTQANADMDNLLATTRVGVIFLDRELRIRRATPEIRQVFHFAERDVGRRIDAFAHKLEYDDLVRDVERVVEKGETVEKEVGDRQGTAYLLRIVPYHANQGIEGAVLTLIDIESLKMAERDLARFKFIADHGRDLKLIVNADGRIQYVNHAVCKTLRRDEAELLSAHISIVGLELQDERFEDLFDQAQQDQIPLFESVVESRDGHKVPVEVSLTGMRFDGTPVLYATLRNISQRKQTERRVAAEHAVTEVLAEERSIDPAISRILNGLVHTLDVDQAEYWSPNETRTHLVMRAQSAARGEAGLREWRESALETEFARGEGLPGKIWRDGAADWVTDMSNSGRVSRQSEAEEAGLKTAFGFPVMAMGEVLGVVVLLSGRQQKIDEALINTLTAMGRQIGQFVWRIRSEEALRLRDRAVAAARDGIIIVDAQQSNQPIIYVNEGFTKITGYSAEEAAGRNCRFLQGPDTDRATVQKLRTAIRQKRPCRVTLQNYRKDGEKFWNELQVTPVRDESGEVTHFMGVQHDVTRRIVMEQRLRAAESEAKSANQAKSEFLANMSHEIRTPMTAILGFSELLLQRTDDDELIDGLTTIKRNGAYLLELINDILDLSQIEAGRIEIQSSEIETKALVSEVVKLMSIRAQEKQLPLNVEFGPGVPSIIRSDRTRLRQILVNLIGNAIKFTDAGSVRLRVQSGAEDPGELCWSVTDTGIGMSEQQQQRLFEPFTQADAKITQQFGGTGLGLSISQRLAKRLGGRIEVESKLGEGSTFSLIIPIERRDDVDLMPEGEFTPSSDQEPSGDRSLPQLECSILIADDRRDIWRVASHFLEQAGASVTVAEHGEQAVRLIEEANRREQPFDLVLMDMQMPVMSGFEATAKLRLSGFDRPIIALTAGAMQGDRDACLKAGCDDYLAKPIDGRELVNVVAQYVHSRRRRSGSRQSQRSVSYQRVLIVDDGVDAAEALAQLLEFDGFESRVATSGEAALELAREFRPEVVISDINLPDIDGYRLLGELRELESLQETLFIAWSGDTSPQHGRKALAAGFDRHLGKPIDIEQLRSLLIG